MNFYSDSKLENKTGIPIYGSKPYVLVKRTKAKDKPLEISIEYITDRSQVIYADPRGGFGSADLKLSLSNGQLTQFGQITDTKIPELISAVSGLLTARGNSEKALAEADSIKGKIGVATTQSAKVPDASTLREIKVLLFDMTRSEAVTDLRKLDPSELSVVQRVEAALGKLSGANPAQVTQGGDDLIEAGKDFAALPEDRTGTSARTIALQRVTHWKPRLAGIVASIMPDAPAPADDFELYEITHTGGLRRVK
ncbi:hypothetical protein [Acidovorax sp. CF316]|uniref:hypothetical protein n=1 Tax=Acidovorax sp. CF316 TaxID=1144317 RepID=UPI0011B21A77|nr:hypothetical protein [Acidovorax sp. CF316]